MKKVNWYTYLQWPQSQKDAYPFFFVNEKNEVQCYEQKEKAAYTRALKKKGTGVSE